MSEGLWPSYLAECLGTFVLVFSIGINILVGSPIWCFTSIGCTLAALIYALCDVCPAHFNPAVTASFVFSGKMFSKDAAIYIVMQTFGGILAACFYNIVADTKPLELQPSPGFEWWQAALTQMAYTCMLCFVVLNVAPNSTATGKNQYYGLAIGLAVIASGHGGGHISNGFFNPAAEFAVELTGTLKSLWWCLLYLVFDIMGSFLAAGFYRMCRAEDYEQSARPLLAIPEHLAVAVPSYALKEKLVAEFMGTFFLVLTIGMNVLARSTAPVFSIGAALMSMIFAVGGISGGHFNPAVTLGTLAAQHNKELQSKEGAAYIGAQLVAAAMAGITYATLDGDAFPLTKNPGVTWFHVAFAETLFTMVLVFVALSVNSASKELSEFAAVAVGAAFIGGSVAIGAISGGVLNPAAAFGVALSGATSSTSTVSPMQCIPFMFFQLCGSGLAAVLYHTTMPFEYAAVAQVRKAGSV